ncbi:MAG: leucine--tRNA ligase [Candidatus Lambdaproteobacteria bacterium]|nr:leucine--tRNA ligase [Candidatus Lambdaproteobacteria bacterium]
MSDRYTPAEIEARWRQKWEAEGIYELDDERPGKRFYWLTMLPYPSGDLHIGHWYAMVPSDAGARFKRMTGHNVFFPIGFDAFGLPAENAAIKRNIHPREWTYANIERMRGQLKSMGAMFAWRNEVITCEPEYYKWNQWIFRKLFDMGLAYREFAPVDFCPSCNTTLAREQVVGEARLCERCDTPVVKKELNQWKLRITRYAEELLDFSGLEWPEAVRVMQTNWIGRSEGVEFEMAVEGSGQAIRVYTTRPDTIFGITFCVLSPEHPLVEELAAPAQREAVRAYREQARNRSEVERMSEARECDGVFTGAYARHPFTGKPVPIWIADYVLMGYGTGAIMAVPAHDSRDFTFAGRYRLPIVPVVRPAEEVRPGEGVRPADGARPVDAARPAAAVPGGDGAAGGAGLPYTEKEGSAMFESGPFSGLVWPESFRAVAEALEKKGTGQRSVKYRLRDWLISRQRMWGTPIPIVYCKACGTVPVPYEQLPVRLPDDAVYKPTGESPLKYHEGFLRTACPACGGPAERETDTMDTFVCSSWYMYAYLSPYWKRGQRLAPADTPWEPERGRQWLPIDQYTGGIEHAIMHLLYLRFFAYALADAGALPLRAPVRRLFNQGIILGEDNEKMSKSRGNVVNPDDIVARYGADAVRLYLMFIGPWDQGGPWNPQGIEGVVRFLHDIWYLIVRPGPAAAPANAARATELRRAVHRTLKRAGEDYQSFKYNTLIAALMVLRNQLKTCRAETEGSPAWEEAIDTLLLMMAPLAPYATEELWQRRHRGASIHVQPWPRCDPALATEARVTVIVQVNGKVRDRIELPLGTPADRMQAAALEQPKVRDALGKLAVRKVIAVENKLVNIVAG